MFLGQSKKYMRAYWCWKANHLVTNVFWVNPKKIWKYTGIGKKITLGCLVAYGMRWESILVLERRSPWGVWLHMARETLWGSQPLVAWSAERPKAGTEKSIWAFLRPKVETETDLSFFEAKSWNRKIDELFGGQKLKQKSIWDSLRPIAEAEIDFS